MNIHLPLLLQRIYYWLTPVFERLPAAWFPFHNRRFHAYVVGMPRSGTVSIYDTFKNKFRSAHEPESRFFTNKVVAYRLGQLDEKSMRTYLRHRDRRLGLELDSSYLNGEVIGLLAEEFPHSKFILTLRDCLSWSDSMINFFLNKPEFMRVRKSHVLRHMDLVFGTAPYSYFPEESLLMDKGLHPLSCYLTYWAEHNRRVIGAVSPERLLVLQTSVISKSEKALESFLGLQPDSLAVAAHSNSAPIRHSIVSQLPQEFVLKQVEEHCGELMQQYFPEVLDRLR